MDTLYIFIYTKISVFNIAVTMLNDENQSKIKYTGWAVSRAPKNLKQIKGKLKLKINFDWNQPNLKVIVTDTFKEKKGCFIPLFLHCFHHTTRKSLVRDLRVTLYIAVIIIYILTYEIDNK